MRKLLRFLGIGIIALGSSSLHGADQQKPEPAPGSVIAAGDIRAATGFYSVIFYFAPKPLAPPEATARDLVARMFPGVPIVTDPENTPPPPFVGIEIERPPLENFPVPDAAYFKYAGRGLSPADIAAIQKTDQAFRLILIVPSDKIWEQTRRFTELALAFADKTGAFIWDSATRECFSRAAWKERRLDTWTAEIPSLPDQFTIHAYRVAETNYVRAITLGLEKFALPDLVVQEVMGTDSGSAGNLINLTAQLLAENPVVASPAKHGVSLTVLKNDAQRQKQTASLKKGATQQAVLALVAGRVEEGDPSNRLVELDFRHGEGRSGDEKREAMFSALWGATDSVVQVKHDDELLAASRRAKARLPELQRRFAAGLPVGEQLQLKAPFATDDDGTEWMWVEVLRWSADGKVTGILQNDPFYVKKLRAGSRVVIKAGEVFDYILFKADGSQEGNETGKIMQRQSEAAGKR